MQISGNAQGIYQSYISRATTSGQPNAFTKGTLDSIFESAAGPDGVLDEREAEGVSAFIDNSGLDISEINYNEAEKLADDWSTQAAHYLPAITASADITQGFERLASELGTASSSGKIGDLNRFRLNQAVFFNRIMKGKDKLSANTLTAMRTEVDDLMKRPEMRAMMPQARREAGEFCLNLLRATASSETERREVHNSFIDKFFPNDPVLKKIA